MYLQCTINIGITEKKEDFFEIKKKFMFKYAYEFFFIIKKFRFKIEELIKEFKSTPTFPISAIYRSNQEMFGRKDEDREILKKLP